MAAPLAAVRPDPSTPEELKARIMRFVGKASTEITPAEAAQLPQLSPVLPPGSCLYIAHTPKAQLHDVVHAALAVRRAGFIATPHIVARRIASVHALRSALRELRDAGIEQLLLVAGDTPQPAGDFTSTLDVLDSGVIEQAGIGRVGVAGHPEGHKAVGASLLWEALRAKQAFAARTGIAMHIVTQFGFNASAIAEWEQERILHGIDLPVHVGIAGPAPLSRLIHYAMQCGIGASLRTVMRNLSAVGSITELAISPDQHLLRLLGTGEPAQVVAPHFFAFGGTVQTARWAKQVRDGAFDVDLKAARLVLRA